MDFAKVDGSLVLTGSLVSARYLDADMQFKTMIPDQRTRPALCRKRKLQDNGRTTATHRQDDPTRLDAHRLRGRAVALGDQLQRAEESQDVDLRAAQLAGNHHAVKAGGADLLDERPGDAPLPLDAPPR